MRNLGFDAPGFLETGRASDFTTHLAVFQDGQQIAEKTIRVNDPLTVGGYTFHQNGFGPAPDVVIRDADGQPLWTGPIPMTDEAAGFPFTEFAVPGRDVALQLLLQRQADGTGVLLVLPFRAVGTNADGSPQIAGLEPLALTRGESDTAAGTDFSVELRGFQDFTLLIAKRDPGQGLIWLAAGCLIVGLLITFWMPRRRVWAKVGGDGRVALTVRADRYVDVTREFGAVLDDLVKARGGASPSPRRPRPLTPAGDTAAASAARAAHFPAMAALHEILATLLPDADSIGAPVPPRRRLARRRLGARPAGAGAGAGRARAVRPRDRAGDLARRRRSRAGRPRRPRPDARPERRLGAAARPGRRGDPARTCPTGGPPDALAQLGEAAADAGLPAIRVHGLDPAALEQRLIGFLVDRRGELERQSSVLEGDLAQLAMAARGVESLIAAIGAFLHRAVALEGRRSDTIAVHAPADVPDAAAAVAAYLARPLSGGKRVPLPGRPRRDVARGLARAPRGAPDQRPRDRRHRTRRAAAQPGAAGRVAGPSRPRRERPGRSPAERRPAVGRARGPPAGVEPGRPRPRGDPPGAPVPVRRPPAQPPRDEREPRPARDRRARAGGPAGPPDREPRGRVPGPDASPCPSRSASPAARPTEEANARATLEAAERLAEPPLVARADRLAAYRLLASLGSLPDDRMQATALLEPLLGGRPASVRERLATLRAVLDHGAAGEAASRLGIHRNTLAYRVRNLEARTGWDLADPELRLALSVAVRVVQSAQQTTR